MATAGSFETSTVTSLSVQVLSAGTTGPWVTSTVHIDSITAAGDAIGPRNFTSNASALALQGGAVAGAALGFIP